MANHRVTDRFEKRTKRHERERFVTAVCALVAGASHIPLISEHLREAPYIGWAFIALVAASAVIAVALLRTDAPKVWIAVGVLYAAALLAYLFSRTTGLPQIPDDIGNWTEPESFPALAAEALAVLLAARVTLSRIPVAGP